MVTVPPLEEHVPTPPPKRHKAPGRQSKTGQLFEHYFNLPDGSYPVVIGTMTRGKAINLAIGLNRCNCQLWLVERGATEEAMHLSAKAKAHGGLEAERAAKTGRFDPLAKDWYVEVSTSYRRIGLSPPSREGKEDWLDELLAATKAPTVVKPSSDDIIANLYGLGEDS